MQVVKANNCTGFSFNELVKLLRPDWTNFQDETFTCYKKECSIIRLVRTYPELAKNWGFLLDQRFIILKTKLQQSRNHTLQTLCDCRFDPRITNVNNKPIYHIVLNHENRLFKFCLEEENKLPLYVPLKLKFKSLGEILNVSNRNSIEPKNIEQLHEYFARYYPSTQNVQFCVRILAISLKRKQFYTSEEIFGSSTNSNITIIEARAGKKYNWIFRTLKKRETKKIKIKLMDKEELNTIIYPQHLTNISQTAWAKNRSCGMKIFKKGLNLAYDLGLISQDDLAYLSFQLNSTTSCLICHNDELGHLRQLAYHDLYNSKIQPVVLDCASNDSSATLIFFQQIETVKECLRTIRRKILENLMSKLDKIPKIKNTLYSYCKKQIEQIIRKQVLIIYCSTDIDMHNLKYMFGKHILYNSKKHLCRLHLKTDAQNDIIALQTVDYCLINIASYTDISKDFKLCNILNRQPMIQHLWQDLLNCHPSVIKMLNSQNEYIGKETIQLWLIICKNFIHFFDYDIYPMAFQSFPGLSWQAIHSKSARNKGMFGRATEKLKPFYNNLLRQYAKGGFMFSARHFFTSDQIIGKNPTNDIIYRAACVKELDISSSYGYSASTSLLPGGFTVAFVNQHTTENMNDSKIQQVSDILLKTDSNRCKSFEFRAVYFTIRQLELESIQSNNPDQKIHTVYSNFSPMGVFKISKCILDLAIILGNGSLLLFNFDTNFSHACNICPKLARYIGNQSYAELRIKSLRRDAIINDWINQCGLSTPVFYTVLTECHHLEYTSKNLTEAFKSDPILRDLEQDCPTQKKTDSNEIVKWIKNNYNNRNFTFLAITKGKAISNQTPLIIQSNKKSKSGHKLTTSTENDSCILLSREYLEYLFENHKFEVEKFEAILFFGVDQQTSILYNKLTQERHSTNDIILSDMLKKIINLSIGYYGTNENKSGKPKYILTNKLPKNYVSTKHSLVDNYGIKEWDNGDTLLVYQCKTLPRKTNNNALHLHLTVIEFAKLRLISFINFLQAYLEPGSFQVTYANTDNIQIVLAATEISQLVKSNEKQFEFIQKWKSFVLEKKRGGYFKIEWSAETCFTYVTAFVQNYAIIAPNLKTSRWSGITNLSPQEILKKSIDMLHKKVVVVSQERRTNKINDCNITNKQIMFKPDNDQKQTI